MDPNASGGDPWVRDELFIRDFVATDQHRVRSLILSGLGEHWGAIDLALNRDLADIARSYRHGRTLVAELHGAIVGTATVIPDGDAVAKIVRTSVDRAVRRRGVGLRIVEALIETARGWGLERVILETSAHWEDVVAFYLRCGFMITHHSEGAFGRDTWFEYRL